MATTDAEAHALTARRYAKMRPLASSKSPVVLDGLPPGPRWPAIVQSIALLRSRHQFVPWAHRTYGDAFTMRILPQGRPIVLFTKPEQAREIFAGDPEVFHAGKGNAILGPMMGEHSLLLQDSSEHKRARKLLMPAFNGHALREYAALVTDVATAEGESWLPGESFSALQRMNRLTLEVILRVVFGVTDETRLAEMRPRVNKVVDISPAILFGYGMPQLQNFGPWKRSKDNAFELDALIYAEIRERRAASDLASRPDVLSRLIRVGTEGDDSDRLTDEELRDQLITLLLAGHETTATALAWALYEVGRSLAARAVARRCPRWGRRLARGSAQGVDAAAPGDPDGGADADEAGHRPRLRLPASARWGRRSSLPTRASTTTIRPRRSGPNASSRASPPPTPGSRSAAAYAVASAPASR